MNTGEVVELEGLLSEAMKSLTIELGSSGQLSMAQFRQSVNKCRRQYDPDLSRLVSSCKPEIRQPEVRGRLLEFVSRMLADHIRDGKIHSATIAFLGGLSSGSSIENVAKNLLGRTIADGPAIAARAFADCTTNSSCNFLTFFLVTGVSIPAQFEIFDGITLIPLPDTASALPPHLPDLPIESDRSRPITLGDLLGRTLVRVEYEVSPIFHRPDETYTFESLPSQHFSIKLKGQGLPDPNLNTLCQALSVVARCRVQSAMSWTSLLDYEIFDLSYPWGIRPGGWSGTDLEAGLGGRLQLTAPQMETIKVIYMGLTQLPTETWEKLRIPIDRWAKSMAEENPLDQIVDLGISLESLYVPDSQGESGFRLASHASWHLGSNKVERRKLWKEFRDIYDARSHVVHTGRLRGKFAKSSFDKAKFVKRGQDLCWQGITSVIEAGAIPDWSDLTMGDDVGSA